MIFKEKSITIHKNDLCPCGSNKKFSECCSSLNHQYTSFGKNYEGHQIIFDKTNQKEIQEKLEDIIPNITEEGISVTRGKEQLKNIYSIMDEGLEEYHKQSSCKKGCNICCCDYLDCSAVEAELIREYIINKFKKDKINVFEEYIKTNIDNSPKSEIINNCKSEAEISKIVNSYFDKKIKCIFLDINGECSIYPVRPISCRKHLVISNPQNCNKNNNCKMMKPYFMRSILLYTDMLSRNITRYRKLTLLGREISKEEYLKYVENKFTILSIHRSFYEWFKNGFNSISLDI